MASKNFTGYLRDPLGEYAEFDKWTFTHITTTGETVAGCTSILNIGADGFYNIDIEYGQVNIRTKDTLNKNSINQGTYVINSETLVTTLPALLNAEVPVSDPVILEMEAILADAEAAADAAEQSADEAAISAAALNDIRYSKLDNPLTHLFKKNKLVDTLVGDLTWTRASNATYVDMYGNVKTAEIDEPRQEKEGWLIEGASTNLLLNSSDMSSSGWVARAGSSLEHTEEVKDPSGGSGVTKHVNTDTSTSGTYMAQVNVYTTDDTVYTASMMVKQGTQDEARITMYAKSSSADSVSVIYRFSTGEALTSSSGNCEATAFGAKSLADGWVRVWVSANMLTGSNTAGVRFSPSAWGVPLAVGSEYGYICNAQVEVSLSASSYIPTTDSPATRSADVVSFNTAENVPDAQGEWSIVFSGAVSSMNTIYRPIYQLGNTLNNTPGRDGWSNYIDAAGDRLRSRFKQEDFGAGSGDVWNKGEQFSSYFVMNKDRVRDFYVKSEQGDFLTSDQSTITDLYTDPLLPSAIMPAGLSGHIQDFRIYDYALNAAEVAFLAGE